jgi:hypothetical protein
MLCCFASIENRSSTNSYLAAKSYQHCLPSPNSLLRTMVLLSLPPTGPTPAPILPVLLLDLGIATTHPAITPPSNTSHRRRDPFLWLSGFLLAVSPHHPHICHDRGESNECCVVTHHHRPCAPAPPPAPGYPPSLRVGFCRCPGPCTTTTTPVSASGSIIISSSSRTRALFVPVPNLRGTRR